MSNTSKVVVALLVLAAFAAGAFHWLGPSDGPPVPAGGGSSAVSAPPQAPPQPPPLEPATQHVIRTAPGGAGASNSSAAQGVRGRILLPNGAVAAGVPVLLLESTMNSLVEIFVDRRSGKVRPPLASGQTGADGTFALGHLQPSKTVDLRVVSPDHPELHRTQIEVRDGDWFDCGDLQLEQGLPVTGRVIEAASKAPVADATVFLEGCTESHTLVPTPGRERGVSTTTDANGAFRFTNAPRQGLVNLAVEAPGHATAQLRNQQLKPEHNDFTIEVELGQPIGGFVVDQDGQPIAGATVTATGFSAKTPQNAIVASADDGSFEFPSLRTGPYQVIATSGQHAEVRNGLVMTGDLNVKLVCVLRGTVKLRVLGADKTPVKAYRLGLKRFFPKHPLSIGNVPEFPDRTVTAADHRADLGGEWALIRGLPSGELRFQIEASGHAKTLSPPFTVVEGGPVFELVVQLIAGGSIHGKVVDDRGRPVAGANVSTDLDGGLAGDLGFLGPLRDMMPEKHTRSSVTTDAQGGFRFDRLAYADYMVRVSHPDYCEGTATGLKVETEGQKLDAGVIQLAAGATVEGVTMVGGQPSGQIKVSLSAPIADNAGAGRAPARTARAFFNASAVSDGDGRFRLLQRVPPGTYKISASRTTTGSPFDVILDIKQTEQQLVIEPGRDVVPVSFNLTKR